MSSSLLIGLEMAGVLGAVLLWGFWELYTLRRDNRRAAEAEAAKKQADPAATDAPPPSGS